MVERSNVFFDNRVSAGEQLASQLNEYREEDVVVLGVPRGGVPVAAPVAKTLNAELDVIVVKKLGAPGNPELAIGAVGEDGTPYLNEDVLASRAVDDEYLTNETRKQHERVKELASEFRDVKRKASLTERTVVLVDDGIATGATTRACLEIISQENPETLVLAVPVAPKKSIREIQADTPVDRIVCPEQVEDYFGGIGGYFRDFGQVPSDEVRRILKEYNQSK
jgi:putative phosphoribosyl transferase